MPERNLIPANSVNRTLNIIGDRWTLLVLGYAFQGVRRYSGWRSSIGIASNILSNRLKRLVESGCMTKVTYDEKPNRAEYRLTEKGFDLYPLALMVWRFEKRWGENNSENPATLIHTNCGKNNIPAMKCRHCLEELHAHDISFEDGPGAGYDPKSPPRKQRRSNVTPEQSRSSYTLFGQSVDLLGNRWAQLVLAAVFQKNCRYDDILQELKIATNILSDRLKRLLNDGILQKCLYREAPDRYEYILTPKGRDIYPMILAMNQWGDKWMTTAAGIPMVLTHKRCGKIFAPTVVCNQCGEELDAHCVKFNP